MAKVKLATTNSLRFFCPGCEVTHMVSFQGTNSWTWNGDFNKPTISPSILVRWSGGINLVCHSFVTDGTIRFLEDSTHKLAGQTVDIPELSHA